MLLLSDTLNCTLLLVSAGDGSVKFCGTLQHVEQSAEKATSH